MTPPISWDIVKSSFPAFADLRDTMNLQTIDSDHSGGSWVVRMEGERLELMVGVDRADQDFSIRLPGRKIFWSIPTVLHELGLWGDTHPRVDPTKLAQVLEQNLEVVLDHISRKSDKVTF